MEKDYTQTKQEAIALRKAGWSYGEIRDRLQVSKSTLSLWLKHIRLSDSHKKRLYTKQTLILNSGPRSQKKRREEEIEEIIQKAKSEILLPVDIQTVRLFGAALYWAEGSKGKMFDMTNSDPKLILFWVHWLKKIFNIPASTLKARLNIYPQQNERNIKKFWSELTGIPYKNFMKSYVKPYSKNYKKNNLYYGTVRIEVPKSTNLRHRVFGWLQAVLKDTVVKVTLAEKKWVKLRAVAKPVNLV